MKNLSITLVLAWIATTASANLIVNGDFENQPNFGVNGDGSYTYLTGSQLPGWNLVQDHAVTIHNTGAYPFISGTYSANIDGEGLNGHNADMYQDFQTVSGALYDVSFDWQGWTQGIGTLDVRIENVSQSFDTVIDFQYDWFDTGITHHVSDSFFGDGGIYRLRVFMNPETGINDNTFIVDNFSVSQSVPEPASMFAIATGLAALLRKRKRS